MLRSIRRREPPERPSSPAGAASGGDGLPDTFNAALFRSSAWIGLRALHIGDYQAQSAAEIAAGLFGVLPQAMTIRSAHISKSVRTLVLGRGSIGWSS
jgi:hypothetical protein